MPSSKTSATNTTQGKKTGRKATLREVAREAGVSVATASYVINKQKSFGEETKNRVHKAVEKLQYRPNYSAQAMRTGKTKSIGLVLPNQQDPFFPELAKAVENSAHQLGYSVILVDTQQSRKIEKESTLRLIELGVDGIIWYPLTGTDNLTKHHKNLPLVVIDNQPKKSGYDVIHSNFTEGGKQIANHVLKLGHTRIGLIAPPNDLHNANLRIQSFKQSIAGKADLVWEVENPLLPELSEQARSALERQDITMVVAGNDMVAIGTIMHLRELGVSVPESVSVIGYDGTRLSDIVSPKLTTIRQPLSDLGESAVELLMIRMKNPQGPVRHLMLDIELVEGESTCPPGSVLKRAGK